VYPRFWFEYPSAIGSGQAARIANSSARVIGTRSKVMAGAWHAVSSGGKYATLRAPDLGDVHGRLGYCRFIAGEDTA
jgi:hypothetical protein